MSLATKTSLYQILSADATFAALMTGGIHYNVSEIERNSTPTAFDDNDEIKPCCLIRSETTQNIGPYRSSGRLYVVLVFYQRTGYSTIDQAAQRARVLLNDQVFPAHRLVEVLHIDRVPDGTDTALECSMYLDRYEVIRSIVNA